MLRILAKCRDFIAPRSGRKAGLRLVRTKVLSGSLISTHDRDLSDSLCENAEADLETAITLETELLKSAATIEAKRFHLEQLQRLKANRTRETTERLEREKLERCMRDYGKGVRA